MLEILGSLPSGLESLLTPDTWKVLGIVVGSAGAVLSAVAKVFDERAKSDALRKGATGGKAAPRESDRPHSKRSLYVSIFALLIAVAGFLVGFLGEMASQRNAVDAAGRQAADTRRMLEGIARVFTRFETISLVIDAHIQLDTGPLEKYRLKLEKAINVLVDDSAEPGDSRDGVRVITSVEGIPEIFDVGFDYAPEPIRLNVTTADTYLRNLVPYVAIFKRPVDAKTVGGSLDVQIPDLQLIPAPGTGTMIVARSQYEEEKANFLKSGDLKFSRIDMPRDNWSPSGKIMSTKDLEGAEAVIYVPWFHLANSPWLPALWGATKLARVALVVNDQRIDLDVSQFATIATERGPVYSYSFPRLVPF